MTGWGQTGPLAEAAGHDINYIALSGALHNIGYKGQEPVPPLNLVGDFGGGGMLLGQKVSPRVAQMRTLPEGIDQRSACRRIREIMGGLPIVCNRRKTTRAVNPKPGAVAFHIAAGNNIGPILPEGQRPGGSLIKFIPVGGQYELIIGMLII